MHHFSAARAAAGLAMAGALFAAAGCGGGRGGGDANVAANVAAGDDIAASAGDAAASASTPSTALPTPAPGDAAAPAADLAATHSQAQGYTVVTTEILRNGSFASGTAPWVLQDAATVPSELRSGGSALNVGWIATQPLASNALAAGKSYTLIVKARADRSGGTPRITLRFRKPAYSETVRTFTTPVASTAWKDYRIDFTAPNYVAMAELALEGQGGARLLVDSASLKMRSAISQTEYVGSWANSYAPAGYSLVFNDEFNGTSLNRAKWFTRYINGGETQDHLNDEKQRYRDNDNHLVANGVLSLVARKVRSNDPGGVNYESGMIRSDWTARYGYVEARVKMPGGIGAWPAFWLNSDVASDGRLMWPPEIDIFEFVNNGVEDKRNMLHSNVVKQTATTSSTLSYADPAFDPVIADYVAPYNFDEGWHTIGLEWDAEKVSGFVDGKRIYTRSYRWTYADGTLAAPAHILLNFAVGGSWAGRHGIDDSAFPQALQIDWVRAYQKP